MKTKTKKPKLLIINKKDKQKDGGKGIDDALLALGVRLHSN
jgi:hypothetical protein